MSGTMKSGYAGSIFYVSLTRHPAHDKKYTIIGRVAPEGLPTLKAIGNVEVDKNTDKPLKDDVRIKSIKIVPVKG
ncbi:MAG TPA: peptidylprolyl isomerase, partial [Planctomycetota bacterium]|nr:peptidylprolyl isomerase [Planctomycetota bacterium]